MHERMACRLRGASCICRSGQDLLVPAEAEELENAYKHGRGMLKDEWFLIRPAANRTRLCVLKVCLITGLGRSLLVRHGGVFIRLDRVGGLAAKSLENKAEPGMCGGDRLASRRESVLGTSCGPSKHGLINHGLNEANNGNHARREGSQQIWESAVAGGYIQSSTREHGSSWDISVSIANHRYQTHSFEQETSNQIQLHWAVASTNRQHRQVETARVRTNTTTNE